MTRNARSDLSHGFPASQAPRAEVQSPAASGLLLPLGALLLAGSMNAGAQTVPASGEATLQASGRIDTAGSAQLKVSPRLCW